MNPQIRKLFVVTVALFAVLGVAVTMVQFVLAPSLVADQRNSRRYLQAAERDRGPIIVLDFAVAVSKKVEGSSNYERQYPEGPLYAAVTGYFSAINMSATGIESAENAVLEGSTNQLLWQRLRNLVAGNPRQGGGVRLTINPAMQEKAAELLGDRAGAVVALDAKTGAVLALYSSPSFDPQPLASLDSEVAAAAAESLEQDPARPLDNRAIAGNRYAPGSTFKILTAIALLESGTSPGTLMKSPPSTLLPGTSTAVRNVNGSECGDGNPTLSEAFARSCNTTFVIASEGLPAGALQDVTSRFGFGETIKIPLTVTPSVFPENPDAAQLALSALGQSDVQVTPLQMAMVVQAVAKGGVMMQPYLVDSVVDADNKELTATVPRELANPVRAEIAAEVVAMMVDAVEQPYGSASRAGLSGVSVAAKTGTAEVGNGRTNAWTVGFAPADDPRVVVSVIVEGSESDPTPAGGTVAAPIVSQLLEVGLR